MAHPDLDHLLNAAIPFAQQCLAKRGGFLPFALTLDTAGKLQMHGANPPPPGSDHPPLQELIDLLLGALRSQAAAGNIKAATLCMDIRTTPPDSTEKTDAIGLWLEHASHEAVDVALPYTKSPHHTYTYGTLFALPGNHHIFPRPTPANPPHNP
jgi:hypothetical protein